MKCPKCGYLGFEDSQRCRNCGFEFSLAPRASAVSDATIRPDPVGRNSGADLLFDDITRSEQKPVHASDEAFDLTGLTAAAAPDVRDLPLFGGRASDRSEPGVAASLRPRAPLAVRRATPEVPRARTRTPHAWTDALDLEGPPAAELGERASGPSEQPERAAPVPSRVAAALMDATLMGGLDATVGYFTLRLCGLQLGEWNRLSVVPLVAFLLLLNGGYFVAFTAVGGQSIGKMALGIKVVGQDGGAVSVGRAALRALVCLASALPLGLGFLLAVVGRDRRALHDRLARTRVVKPSSH